MVYKNFRIRIIFRVLLLLCSITALSLSWGMEAYRISSFLLGLLIAFQVYELISYAEKVNKKLAQFLLSVKHADFTTSFQFEEGNKSFRQLNDAFNEVIEEFNRYRAEKEEKHNYLQTVVQHIDIGILVFDKTGKVDMLNKAVRDLMGIPGIKNIRELESVRKGLADLLLKMKSGDKNLIRIFHNDELFQIAIIATEFRMHNENFILVSMQDIHTELEEKEIEAWQKMIRVLTHEIMNSMTPISSLSDTLGQLLFDENEEVRHLRELSQEDLEGIHNAIHTIANRAGGLLKFVEVYRNLTRIPKPNFKYFEVKDLFVRTELLMKARMGKNHIDFKYDMFPKDIMITADPDLIDQVLINLLVNAIDAVKTIDDPKILMRAFKNRNNRVCIEVQDNGHGIKPDILDKIFMPFFTSKKTGSGVGLSLSRQIMHLHKGSISVKSKLNEGTVFSITF